MCFIPPLCRAFSEGTALCLDFAGVIWEDKDLASLVLHGLFLLKVMDAHRDGTWSGAGGGLRLEGVVRPVDFDWMGAPPSSMWISQCI